jgi:hypothetical protein
LAAKVRHDSRVASAMTKNGRRACTQHAASTVGDDKADARVQLARMPLDLSDNTRWLPPALRLITEAGEVSPPTPAARAEGKTTSVISPLALEAVRRIEALFEIERTINGESAERRRAVRQELGAPLVTDLERWLREQRRKLSRGKDLKKFVLPGGTKEGLRMLPEFKYAASNSRGGACWLWSHSSKLRKHPGVEDVR